VIFERESSAKALSSGTERCSVELHRAVIPKEERPVDVQFLPFLIEPMVARMESRCLMTAK